MLCVLGELSSDQLAAAHNVALLNEKVPLELDFCKWLGYKETSKVNFMKQSQSETKSNRLYNALLVLDNTGCSEFIKPLTCSIFAPAYLDEYKTSLPPCRSLCKTAERHCSKFLPYMRKMLTGGKTLEVIQSFLTKPC